MHPIAQTGESDCSPVAVANAICWANSWRYSDRFQTTLINKAIKLCKTNDEGTDDRDFIRALKKLGKQYGFKLDKIEKVNKDFRKRVGEIVSHIKKGGAVIISHVDIIDSNLEWHHSFWFNVSCTGCVMGANVLGSIEFYACPPEGLAAILKISKAYGGGGVNVPDICFLSKLPK